MRVYNLNPQLPLAALQCHYSGQRLQMSMHPGDYPELQIYMYLETD